MGRYDDWPRYVPVAERRQKAEKKIAAMKKQGKTLQPVVISGRNIANTFWGKAWCDNLEVYSDWANRLPRGRTYVRNGSVLDLQVEPGRITAQVMGSELYRVNITIQSLELSRWQSIQQDCAGKIDSLIELLQGKLSKGVMEVITKPGTGLFPNPREVNMHCSCPDYAGLCKHLAAVFYGIGARLDLQPELLFLLRQVDHNELLIHAAGPVLQESVSDTEKQLDDVQLSSLFGIDLGSDDTSMGIPENTAPPIPTVVKSSTDKSPEAKPPVTRKTPVGKSSAPKFVTPASVVRSSPPAPAPVKNTPTSGHRARARQVTPPSPPPPPPQVTARELTARGISRSAVQSWLVSGVLLISGMRGVYLTTEQTEARIQQYLERNGQR
ncbi:SWIM-type domain-containing protein [Gammaproteobacteria bacterium]